MLKVGREIEGSTRCSRPSPPGEIISAGGSLKPVFVPEPEKQKDKGGESSQQDEPVAKTHALCLPFGVTPSRLVGSSFFG